GVKVVKDKKLSKPANPTKDNYIFIEWQLNNVAFDFESVITKDITLVAKWESNGSLDDWDVENADGGVKISKYKKVAVNLVIPTRINGFKVVNISSTMLPNRSYVDINNTLISVDMSQAIYLTIISNKAFAYCDKLNKVTFNENLVTIEYAVFYNCHSLNSIVFPDSLEIIEGGAFRDCNLTNVTFGRNLKEIRDNEYWSAFGENKIEKIDLLNTKLEELGEAAFFDCKVKVIKLPSTLLNIDDGVTINNPLEEIYITREELPLTKLNGTQAFCRIPSEFKGKIFYPRGTNYKNEPNWKDFTSAQWIKQ
ncbi:MAG: leucine-rich repeat protein, partial [Marinifilaceae bacterium]